MVKRYHLDENGPAECRASVRSCPVGGEHFDGIGDAVKAFEKKLSVENGIFRAFSNNVGGMFFS